MKTSLTSWAIALAVALFTPLLKAGEPPAPPVPKTSWWTDFSITPYGAVKHPDFSAPVWGAGLDLGYSINRSLSIHVANSVFDQPDTVTSKFYGESINHNDNGWFTGSAIDETELLFRADLIKTGGQGKDRFVTYVIGGASRDWEREDWGFGVGAGAEVRLSKNLSLGADSRIRAWFNNEKDVITRGFLSLRF